MGDSIKEMAGGITQQIGTFLPNIAAAIGVLIIGWIIAHLLGRIAKLAVRKTGVDHKLAGLLSSGKQTDIGKLVGKIVYYIAMLFVFVTFFNVLDLPIVSKPLSGFLDSIFEFLPRMISALVLGLVAWGLATVGRLASRRGLEAVNIDGRLAAIGQDVSTVTATATRATHSALQPLTANDSDVIVEELSDFGDTESLAISPGADLDLEPGLIEAEPLEMPLSARSQSTTVANSGSGQIAAQSQLPQAQGDQTSLSQSIPEAVYWLVLFLFLPAILGALQMPGLMEPIQGMFEKALGYLPNLIGAGLILAIGLFIAKIIRQVITNLAASFGADRLGEKVGMASTGDGTKLSGIVGIVAYATILLPILVAALNTLSIPAVTEPASAVLERITSAIPGLIGGAVVLAISFFVAKLISGIVTDLLGGIGFDELPTKLGITSKTATPPSQLAGKALMAVIMLLAALQALPMMGLQMLADQLELVIGFGTQVLVGLVILGLGVYLANVAAKFVNESGVASADKLAIVAKIAIIVFAGAMGLERMGLSTSIVNVAFGTLLGGLGLAAAIAFGWGGRDAAKRLLDRYVD